MNIRVNSIFSGLLLTAFLLVSCGDNSTEDQADTAETTSSGSVTKQSQDSPSEYMLDSTYYEMLSVNDSSLSNTEYPSVESLVNAALEGLKNNDTTILRDLVITEKDFKEIIYPELGKHWVGARDSRQDVIDFLWENHIGSSIKGLRRALRDLSGRQLRLKAVEFVDGTKEYISYTVHEGTVLTLTDTQGKDHQIQSVGSIIVKDGAHMLMSWRDLD